jgi:hypothetical protein
MPDRLTGSIRRQFPHSSQGNPWDGDHHGAIGGARSRAIRFRISINKARGTMISAIWNTMDRPCRTITCSWSMLRIVA